MKKITDHKKPLGIKVIAIALLLLGMLFLLSTLFFVKNSGAVDERLISLGLSSTFFIGLLASLMLLTFLGGYGLEKGLRIGWLASIIFFSFIVLMNIAAFFIEKTEVKYVTGILCLVSLFYLCKKDIRYIYKNPQN